MFTKPRPFSVIATILVVCICTANAAVAPNRIAYAAAAQTSTAKCTDQKLLTSIGTDLTSIADSLKTLPTDRANATYDAMVKITNARLKYEDMDTPSDQACNYLVTETIILFANIGDFGLINMGSKLGLDTSADTPVVTDRLNKQIQRITDLAGTSSSDAAAATPDAASSAAATSAAAPAAKCTDQKFIDSINTDLNEIADSIKTIPPTGAGGVYSIMIKNVNFRLKYEDMDVPTDPACSYLWTETIILFANIGDFGMLNLGSKLGIDVSEDMATSTDRLTKQLQKVNALVGTAPSN